MDNFRQNHPDIHRHLFTVTTFSKILALVLFILFPFVGFYLGIKYKEVLTSQQQVATLNPQTAKDEARSSSQYPSPPPKFINETNVSKKYTNERYGFTINIPSGFIIDGPYNNSPADFNISPINNPGFSTSPISIHVYNDSTFPYGKLLNSYGFAEINGKFYKSEKLVQTINIDGITGLDFNEFQGLGGGDLDYKGRDAATYRNIIIRRGDTTILIKGIEDYSQLFAEIIKTVKFTY
jgi:hypothetical protein